MITSNQLRGFWRKRRTKALGGDHLLALADQLADPASGLSRCWDEEYNAHLTRSLLEAVRPRFRGPTWAAFAALVLDGRPVEEVTVELGMSRNAVLIAKSRVLSALREEGRGLLDEEGL
jgi:RNA polymerase sigma-70 factor (ECF subfamily)